MTINILSMRCPSCGASLSIPNEVKFCSCSYCGSQLKLVSEGGIALLREISKTVDSVHETVQRSDKTLNILVQRLDEHFSPAPPKINFTPAQTEEGFDWVNLGSILFTWLGVAFIGGISGASWALFWTPFLFYCRYSFHQGLSNLPFRDWEFKQKATAFVYALLMAAALVYKLA